MGLINQVSQISADNAEVKERKNCWKQYSKENPECPDCRDMIGCRLQTGREVLSSDGEKPKALSRVRAMKAFCWECNGGGFKREDCNAFACPLYAFKKSNDKSKAKLWWQGSAGTWNEQSQIARGKKVILKSNDEEEDLKEEEDEEE